MAKIDYQSVLDDFVTTVDANPNADRQTMLQAFPEFNNDEKMYQAALDYYTTRKENPNIDPTDAKIISAFPEFFSPEQPQLPQPKEPEAPSAIGNEYATEQHRQANRADELRKRGYYQAGAMRRRQIEKEVDAMLAAQEESVNMQERYADYIQREHPEVARREGQAEFARAQQKERDVLSAFQQQFADSEEGKGITGKYQQEYEQAFGNKYGKQIAAESQKIQDRLFADFEHTPAALQIVANYHRGLLTEEQANAEYNKAFQEAYGQQYAQETQKLIKGMQDEFDASEDVTGMNSRMSDEYNQTFQRLYQDAYRQAAQDAYKGMSPEAQEAYRRFYEGENQMPILNGADFLSRMGATPIKPQTPQEVRAQKAKARELEAKLPSMLAKMRQEYAQEVYDRRYENKDGKPKDSFGKDLFENWQTGVGMIALMPYKAIETLENFGMDIDNAVRGTNFQHGSGTMTRLMNDVMGGAYLRSRVEHYRKESDRYQDNKGILESGLEGDWRTAIGKAILGTVQSAPNLAVSIYSGKKGMEVLGGVFLGTTAALQKYDEIQGRDDLSAQDKALAMFGAFVSECVPEIIGAKRYGRMFNHQTVGAVRKEVQKEVLTGWQKFLNSGLMRVSGKTFDWLMKYFGEGLTEGMTDVMNLGIDRALGIKNEITKSDLLGIGDSFIIGQLSDAIPSGVHVYQRNAYRNKVEEEITNNPRLLKIATDKNMDAGQLADIATKVAWDETISPKEAKVFDEYKEAIAKQTNLQYGISNLYEAAGVTEAENPQAILINAIDQSGKTQHEVYSILTKDYEDRTEAEQKYLDELPTIMQNMQGVSDGIDAGTPKVAGISPIFGTMYQWMRGRNSEAEAFMEQQGGGYMKGIFHRDGVGDVDVLWGTDRAGLNNIIAAHIERYGDFESVEEAMDIMDKIITYGKKNDEMSNDNSMTIDLAPFRVKLTKSQEGSWVVTAYDLIHPEQYVAPKRNETPTPQPAEPVNPGSQQERITQEVQSQVQQITHQDGNLYHVGIKGKDGVDGYVISGNLNLSQDEKDGTINTGGRDLITIKMTDGTVEQVPADEVDVLDAPMSANDRVAQEVEHRMIIEQGKQQFHTGDKVQYTYVDPLDGQQKTVQTDVLDVTDDGVVVAFQAPNGAVDTTPIPFETAMQNLQVIPQQPAQGAEPAQGDAQYINLARGIEGGEEEYTRVRPSDQEGVFTDDMGNQYTLEQLAQEGWDAVVPDNQGVLSRVPLQQVLNPQPAQPAEPAQPAAPAQPAQSGPQAPDITMGTADEYAAQVVSYMGNPKIARGYLFAERAKIAAQLQQTEEKLQKIETGDMTDYASVEDFRNQAQQLALDRQTYQEQVEKINSAIAAIESMEKEVEAQAAEASAKAEAERIAKEQAAKARAELNKQIKERAAEFAKKLGVNIIVFDGLEEIPESQADARAAYQEVGDRLDAWYDPLTGDVYMNANAYSDLQRFDEKVFHEVVSHYGLDKLLTETQYNKLCDAVWNSMDDKNRTKYLNYAKGNYRAKSAQEYQRYAAKEYIAFLSESFASLEINDQSEEANAIRSEWAKICDFIRDLIKKVFGNVQITNEDLANLIHASYVNLQRNAQGEHGTIEMTPEEALAFAEAETDTNPTEAQKKAENYKQGHVTLWGLPITIENPKGSIRRGTDANGKKWEQEMHNTYGKIRRTEGVDGDHIDVFIGPNLTSEKVFVVDQRNVNNGEFDEHKVMLGFDSLEDAQNGYLSNYEEGWQGMGTVTEVTMDEFKKWIDSSHRKTKPFAAYKSIRPEGAANTPIEKFQLLVEQENPEQDPQEYLHTLSDEEMNALEDTLNMMRDDEQQDQDLVKQMYDRVASEQGRRYDMKFLEQEIADRPEAKNEDLKRLYELDDAARRAAMSRSGEYVEKQHAVNEYINTLSFEQIEAMFAEAVRNEGLYGMPTVLRETYDALFKQLNNAEVFDALSKKQGTITGKANKPKINVKDWLAGKDDLRAVLTGVHNDPSGVGVATNAHILIATPQLYDKAQDGKTVTPDGTVIENAKFPNWQGVIDQARRSCTATATVNWEDVRNFIQGCKDKMKAEGNPLNKKNLARIVFRMPDGKVFGFRMNMFIPFAEAAATFDASELRYSPNQGQFFVEKDGNMALVMPLSGLGEERADELDTFFYDMQAEQAPAETPAEAPKQADKAPAAKKAAPSAEVVEQPKAKIGDVGEKIGGARKDIVQTTVDRINVNGETFSKIFPKFDYHKLIESGLEPRLAAGLKYVCEHAKKTYKMRKKRYGENNALEATRFLANYAKGYLLGDTSLDFTSNGWVFTDYGKRKYEFAISLWEELQRRMGDSMFDIDLTDYDGDIIPTEDERRAQAAEKGRKYTPSTNVYFRNVNGESTEFTPRYEIYTPHGSKLFTEEEREDAIKYFADNITQSVSYKAANPFQLAVFRKQGTNDECIHAKIGGKWIEITPWGKEYGLQYRDDHRAELQALAQRKADELKEQRKNEKPVAKVELRLMKNPETGEYGNRFVIKLDKEYVPVIDEYFKVADSYNYQKAHRDEIQAKAQEILDKYLEEKEANKGWKPELNIGGLRSRVGEDWRGGKDVTAEQFRDTFGFRGVEFGNYVTQKERQRLLNECYDALRDMAQLLGVSPKALSLDGQLGFAIGARGGAGAKAHYEPEKNVINLTKKNGWGAVAHEWWHALDYYFGQREKGNPALASRFRPDIRAAVETKFKELMATMQDTDYLKRSMALDRKTGKTYYATATEMGARAFEDYITRQLIKQGRTNDFLSHHTSPEDWNGDMANYPYPIEGDAEQISNAIQSLFDTMDEKTSETTGNQVLFSISNANEEIFFSNAERAVENVKQEKATPEQWLAMIEKSGGLKAGEDKWIGLSDWLKAQSGTLTKQQVLDYIRSNKIQIEEVEYGEYDMQDAFDGYRREYKEYYDEAVADNAEDPQEVAWQRMIDEHGDDFDMGFYAYGDELQWDADSDYVKWELENSGESGLRPIDDTRMRYTTHGLQNKKEIALTVPTIESWNEGDAIHFGDAGEGRAVAWVRFGDTGHTSGPNGVQQPEDVLVIDEIQSKRHQEGRDKGYRPMEEVELQKLHEKVRTGDITPEEVKRYVELSKNFTSRPYDNAVPNAPFEKNWHELAMKRILRYAAENGYDKVAWTTGEQQAERYDLGKVIDRVEVEPWSESQEDMEDYGEPTREIHIVPLNHGLAEIYRFTKDGRLVESDERGKEVLADVVGKDLAKTLLETNETSISGDGLRIGADGMKGFYDEMLPRFMQKYGKKWGVQVGEVTMPDLEDGYQTMHSIDITPEMRESVLQGQPMFSISDGPKEKQFAIIQQTNPMLDDVHTGIRSVEDIHTLEETLNNEKLLVTEPDWEEADIRNAVESGEVTIYSSYPIHNGVFVTPSRMTAEDYAGGGNVYSKTVPVDKVAWIASDEGQFADVDEVESQPLFSITGVRGAENLDRAEEVTTRMDNLEVARLMEHQQKDPKAIRMATGWERGADGLWRYEIPDLKIKSKVTISKDADTTFRLPDLIDAPELFAAYPEMRDYRVTYSHNMPLSIGGKFSKANRWIYMNALTNMKERLAHQHKEELAEIRKQLPAIDDLVEANRVLWNTDPNDKEAMDAAMELCKQASARLKDNPLWDRYRQLDKEGMITEYAPVGDDVLAHEIQHAIQYIEGFSRGSNLEDMEMQREYRRQSIANLQEHIKELEAKLPKPNDQWTEEHDAISEQIELLERAILNQRNMNVQREAYNNAGGEVESRNVQARMKLTPEERRERLLAETEDVAREDQVFLFPETFLDADALSLDVEKYDKENGTEFGEFLAWLGKPWPNTMTHKHFHIAKTGELLNKYGIVGDITIGHRATNPGRHSKNRWHHLDRSQWIDVVSTINTPLAITRYNDNDNSYRIYTSAKINGRNICVGVNVKKAGREVYVSDIRTAYGRNLSSIISSDETLLYPDETKLKQTLGQFSSVPKQQEDLLSQQGYVQSSVSERKGTTNNPNMQISEQENAENFENVTENAQNAAVEVPEMPEIREDEELIDYAKRLKEYNEKRREAERKAEETNGVLFSITNEYGVAEDASPLEMAQAFNAFNAMRNTPDAVKQRNNLINNMRALRDQLRRLREAEASEVGEITGEIEQGVRSRSVALREEYAKSAKLITDFAKAMFRGRVFLGMTDQDFSKMLTNIREASTKFDLSTNLAIMEEIMQKVQSRCLRISQQTLDKAANVPTQKRNATGVDLARKVDAEHHTMITEFNALRNTDTKHVDAVLADLNTQVTEETNETELKLLAAKIAAAEMAKRYLEERTRIGDNQSKIMEAIQAIDDEIHDNDLRGRKRAEAMERRAALMQQWFDATDEMIVLNDMTSRDLSDLTAEGHSKFVEEAQKRLDHKIEILKMAERDLRGIRADKGAEQKDKGGLKDLYLSPLRTFVHELRKFGTHAAGGEGYLYSYFAPLAHDARTNYLLHIRERMQILDEKAKELFGEGATWESVMKNVSNQITEVEDTWSPYFEDEATVNAAGVQSSKKSKPVYLTNGQIMYIYMVNKMSDGKAKLREMKITEDMVAQLKAQLPKELVQLADWLQDEYFPMTRKRYNETNIYLYGTPMAEIPNYVPLRIKGDAIQPNVDIQQGNVKLLPSNVTGSAISRTVNKLPIDIKNTDAMDLVVQNMMEMEHWSAYAELITDLNTLLNSGSFKNRIEQMNPNNYDNFYKTAQLTVEQYRPEQSKGDALIAGLTRFAATSKIALRWWTALKQTLSAITPLSEADPEFHKQYAKAIATSVSSFKWAMDNLPIFRERWESKQGGNEKLNIAEIDTKIEKLDDFLEWAQKHFVKWGISANAFVDAVVCANMAKAQYETKLKYYTERGYSPEEADRLAKWKADEIYNETQQSNEGAYISAIQRDRTFLSSAISLFNNSSMAYTRKNAEALREIYKIAVGDKQQYIDFRKEQLMKDGMPEAQAAEAAVQDYKRARTHAIADAAINGYFVQFVWNAGGHAFKTLLMLAPMLLAGDDDDKERAKEELLDDLKKDLAISAVQPVRGLPFGVSTDTFLGIVYDRATDESKRRYMNKTEVAGKIAGNIHPAIDDMSKLLSSLTRKEMDKLEFAAYLVNMATYSGTSIDAQTLANELWAIEDVIEKSANGKMTWNDAREDLGILLNVPPSQVERMVLQWRDGEDAQEYAKRYMTYKKLKKYGILTPIANTPEPTSFEKKTIKEELKAQQPKQKEAPSQASKYF